jgi:hypothetical protein
MRLGLDRWLVMSAAALCLGSECGEAELTCIEFSNRTVEVTLADPDDCPTPSAGACDGVTLPERFQLRILDRPVSAAAELRCEVPRAEVVDTLGNVLVELPIDGGLDVSQSARFAVAAQVTLEGTDCTGDFHLSLFTYPVGASETDPDVWLSPSGEPKWTIAYTFLPSGAAGCVGVQSEDCANTCFAHVVSVDP